MIKKNELLDRSEHLSPEAIGSLRNDDGRLRKRHLRSEFALSQTLSRLFHLENCCFVFQSSTKREN